MLEVWQRAPFLKLLGPFVVGIVLFDACLTSHHLLALWCCVSLLILLFVRIHFSSFSFKRRHWYGVFCSALMLSFGALLACYQRPENSSGYVHQAFDDSTSFVCKLVDDGRQVEIEQVFLNDTVLAASMMARLQWPFEDSLHVHINPGSRFMVFGVLSVPKGPLNPETFDYKSYLKRKNVVGVLRIKRYECINEPLVHSVYTRCLSVRRLLLEQMKKFVSSDVIYGVLSALVLGDTSSMQEEIQESYANAGAVHILAVSGLHVGLVYAILAPLMKRLFKKQSARWFKTLLPMLLLWLYAGVTGLSPSVLRAAVMFSFFLVADNYSKKGNSLNTLAASALLLLVYDSSLCFDVGFQLSYAAVAGIVVLQRPLQKLWIPPSGWMHGLWKVSAVSIAAQLATLPFTLYYFQQFPTYFLFTNLLAIPLSTIILYVMLAFLVLCWYEPAGWLLANIGSSLTELMNAIIDFFARLPGGVLHGGFIRHGEPLAFSISLFALLYWWLWTKPKALKLFCVGVVWIGSCRCFSEVIEPHDQWVFHSHNKGDIVSHLGGTHACIMADSTMLAHADWIEKTTRRFYLLHGIELTDTLLLPKATEQQFVEIQQLDLVRLTPELLNSTDTLPYKRVWIGSDMKSFFFQPKHIGLLEEKEIILSSALSSKTTRFLKNKLDGCSEIVELKAGAYQLSY